jgi:1,4-dihydroxy-2-naphthoate polyprenyltransferase
VKTERRPQKKIVVKTSRNNWVQICRTCTLPPERRVDVISRWLLVTRVCVQPMTLTAIAIAGLLAAPHPQFDAVLFSLSALGLVLAHAANNMVNDFFDLESGLDTEQYPRSLYAPHPIASGLVTRRQLLAAILFTNLVDAAIMLILFWQRDWPIVAFALGGLFISVFYVAPPLRLKAHGLGEPGVFLVWGPLMVGGTYYAAVGAIDASVFLASLPYALLVTTVLMGKHIDKARWDEEARVRTLPVILGEDRARRLTLGGMFAFYVVVAALIGFGDLPVWAALVVLAFPRLRRVADVYGRERPAKPPEGYPLWPLWYVAAAFVHSRRAGALLVVGLAIGAAWPVFV